MFKLHFAETQERISAIEKAQSVTVEKTLCALFCENT